MPSASEAPPRKTSPPTCSARPATSWRRLVLPIPGSPATIVTWRRPAVVFSNWLQRVLSSRCLPTSTRSGFGVSSVMTRPPNHLFANRATDSFFWTSIHLVPCSIQRVTLHTVRAALGGGAITTDCPFTFAFRKGYPILVAKTRCLDLSPTGRFYTQ